MQSLTILHHACSTTNTCIFHSGIHCESHCLTYSRRSLYQSKIITRALRAHRVIFMIRVLHISNTLRPVTTRCGNSDLSPSFGHQDRQSIIPRRGKFRARPVVQVHIALAIRQLQTIIKETSRSRPPSSSRFDTEWDKLDLVRRHCTTTINRVLPRRSLLRFAMLRPTTRVCV